jgi:hypothetical protein
MWQDSNPIISSEVNIPCETEQIPVKSKRHFEGIIHSAAAFHCSTLSGNRTSWRNVETLRWSMFIMEPFWVNSVKVTDVSGDLTVSVRV